MKWHYVLQKRQKLRQHTGNTDNVFQTTQETSIKSKYKMTLSVIIPIFGV